MVERRHTVCRVCHVACDLVVTLEDGEIRTVHGNKDNPVYHGFSCIKGRASGDLLKAPSRLLHSLERQPDGSHRCVQAEQAIVRIAARLKDIIKQHGPRSVGLFAGTYCTIIPLFEAFAKSFMRAIDSPMIMDNVTIDQPGKSTAPGLHGSWLAGTPSMDQWQALLLVGANPIVSMNGGLGVNPARQLKALRSRGMKLVVVDPRRTESAAHADIHLQPRPGEDAAIMAGLIRQLIIDDQLDREFVDAETQGIASLAEAIMPFTPEMVAERAGIGPDALVEAARILGGARRGAVSMGTGANMSGNPTTVEYLGRVLTSLRGWWRRAGEELSNPGVFLEPLPAIAGTPGPIPVKDVGEKMRVRGLTASIAGIPVSALPDEMLTPGEGRLRALIVAGANPVMAWPDQVKTMEGLASLDLLVCIDPVMTATAEMADYVLAPKIGLECETNSAANEKWALGGPGWGYEIPYAQVEPPIVEPPAGSDLKEDWEFLFELAQAMDLQLELHAISTVDPQKAAALATRLDMAVKPSTAEAWAIALKGAPVPYEELRSSRGPHLIDRPATIVQSKPADWTGRLDLATPLVMEHLRALAQRAPGRDERFPFRLISRRLNDVVNSCAHDNPDQLRKWPYNPAFMHPSDLAQLGIGTGSLIEIRSVRSQIIGVAEEAADVRPGCISMPHSWGRNPRLRQRPRIDGANTGRLVANDRNYDKLTGQPLMSAIPVSVCPVSEYDTDAHKKTEVTAVT
jgi:anaerobic selenocysteine-containing dehydrogenase